MKVSTLNTVDIAGGAARAAYRLHKGLQGIGIDSRMIVQRKDGDDKTVFGPRTRKNEIFGIIRPNLDLLLNRLYRHRKGRLSPSILPDGVPGRVAAWQPDLIHLHWIAGGFLRIETLRRFTNPLVWTLHDSWAFTGGCHLPFDCTRYQESCGACPTLGSNGNRDMSHWIWQRKHKSWRGLDLTVVTPSRWLAECARSSSLFHDVRVEVIPNGIDLTLFRPIDKRIARDILSLPQDKKLLLFGAMDSTSDKNKGFHLLLPAIQSLLKTNINQFELVVFGASEPFNMPHFGLKARYMGMMHDEIALTLLYSAADVFVLPSLHENLPCTVMESLACGTPCVAFDIGGLSDLIEHERTGYLARPFECDDLARGIAWVLENSKRWQALSRGAREKVENNYAIEKIAERYAGLYQEVVTSSKK